MGPRLDKKPSYSRRNVPARLTGAEGYAKRWASEYGEIAIAETTKYAVARLFHHDPSFTQCDCTGVVPRLKHALNSPFMARTRHGRARPIVGGCPAIVVGSVIPAATYYPAPRGTRDGLAHAGTGIAAKMAVDVFRKFVHVPHSNRIVQFRKQIG